MKRPSDGVASSVSGCFAFVEDKAGALLHQEERERVRVRVRGVERVFKERQRWYEVFLRE